MKKRIVILASLLGVLLLTVGAFAAFEEGKISLNSEASSPAHGHSFTVTLELNRNPGVFALRTMLNYDEKVLELVSVRDEGLLPSFSQEKNTNGKTVLHWKAPSGSGDLTASGVLASLVFRVRDDAPYGESRITVDFSQRLFDATNKGGAALAFDIKAFEFNLVCSHLTTETETVTAPTFSAAGAGTVKCKACGETWESVLMPQIFSEDKKTSAAVQPGEFTDGGEKSLRTEFLFGGELFENAKKQFGDGVIRAFQLHFTREGMTYTPAGETKITLETEFEQPKNFGFYAISREGAHRLDGEWENGKLSFVYQSAAEYYVLVEREETPAISIPEDNSEEEEPILEVPEVTRSPQEIEREREIRWIVLGILGVLLCAAGAIFVLRRGKSL